MNSSQVKALCQQAVVLHQAGRLAEAERLYVQALAHDPNNIEAHYNRGVTLRDLDRAADALASFDRALHLMPSLAAAHANRGGALQTLGRQNEALASYDRAISFEPSFAYAWNNRGLVLKDLKRPQEALDSFDKAISLQPADAYAWNNRGTVLRDLNRLGEALASHDRAITLQPGYSHAWNNRGVVLVDLRRPGDALASYDRAITLQPGHLDAWNNRGAALLDLHEPYEALASVDKALAFNPHFAGAWNNRSMVLGALKRWDEALACCDKALSFNPTFAAAWSNRAGMLKEQRRLDEALASADRAIALDQNYAFAWHNRGSALRDLKRLGEAIASYDRAIALKPDLADAWANRGPALWDLKRPGEAAISFGEALALEPDYDFLFGNYLRAKMVICDWDGIGENIGKCATAIGLGKKTITPFALLGLVDDPALHKLAAKIYLDSECPGDTALGPIPERVAGEKIRIGYYSADFHHHATSFLIAEMLEAHDAARFELHGFSLGPDRQDGMRRRISDAFATFTDVRGMSDRDVTRLSRERGIDIAVDLKGYTQDSRPGIFALGCAPLQLQYLGYPGSMSADYMDYVIADKIVIPPGSEAAYTEKILRLPHSYQPNDSRRKISKKSFSRQEAGLPVSGFVFCCFNNNYKILPETFDSWMRILKAVDGSVLWLLEDNLLAAENLRRHAVARGVDATRLIFASFLPVDEHLARHKLADLFLDTWPYNAHTTASDAMWTGLLVLTRTGQSFASRVAASLLNAAGLPGMITGSREEYEALAIALAKDSARLADLRKTLTDARASAPLFDGKLTARHLEAGFEAIWARYQSGLPPEDIDVGLA
jgi:protein O-GlcNAc transferase